VASSGASFDAAISGWPFERSIVPRGTLSIWVELVEFGVDDLGDLVENLQIWGELWNYGSPGAALPAPLVI